MREMLAPIFGEGGAVVAQFLLLLILILLVIWLGYWLFYRFSSLLLGGRGRSRLPRLAIIDTLPIDHLHRLVLIRRDNVEHLVLIGKTTDLVVESSIVRAAPASNRPRQTQASQTQAPQTQVPRTQPQQPQQAQKNPLARSQPDAVRPLQPAPQQAQPASGSHQPPSRPAEAAAPSEPIPFPQAQRPQARLAPQFTDVGPAGGDSRRATPETIPQRRAAVGAAAAPAPGAISIAAGGAQTVSASAHFEEPARPTQIDSAFSLADALDKIADEPAAAPGVSQAAVAERPSQTEASAFRPPSQTVAKQSPTSGLAEGGADTSETNSGPAPATAVNDTATDSVDPEDSDEVSAATVSNLEEEMARLLGQITSKRES